MKKAIVTVGGSFKLYQAIFLTYLFPDYDWDILLISYGKKEEIKLKLKSICEKSNRFKNIYLAKSDILSSEKIKLLLECVKLTVFYISGNRRKYAEKIILSNVEQFDYDMLCVASSYSLIEGAMLNFASNKRVIVIEEGLDDYVNHKRKFGLLEGIGAKLLFKMQYINLLYDNSFVPLKHCEKYVRYPHLIRENHYKKVNQMFDYSKIDESNFQKSIKEAFEIKDEFFDVVVYTDPLWSYGLEDKYVKFAEYIQTEYLGKKILLKRHPQDDYHYDFGEVDVVEGYLEVPGEMVIQQWRDAVHIFTFPSTILLGIEPENIRYKVARFVSDSESYNVVFNNLSEFLKVPENSIVEL